MHVPPLPQEVGRQSSMLTEQSWSEKPDGHWHSYPSDEEVAMEQVAPLRHTSSAKSTNSKWKNWIGFVVTFVLPGY